MEIGEYVRVLRKRWKLLVIATLVGIAAAIGATVATTPVFEARTQVFVSVQSDTDNAGLQQGNTFTQQRVKSYAQIVNTPLVLQPVVDSLGLTLPVGILARDVRAEVPLDTVLVNVVVRSGSPTDASRIANAVAESFRDRVADLERPTAGGTSPVRINIVSPAGVPSAPVAPSKKLNLALGLLLGLALGVGLAVLLDTVDTRVRSARDVESVTTSPVLGALAKDPKATERPMVVAAEPHSLQAEAFRHLRTNLQFLDVPKGRRSFLVTSSTSGEGKSTTSANLAATLAAAGARVILVEADLRRPMVSRYLGLEGAVGLTNVLIGQVALADVIQRWGTGTLDVLPAGHVPPNPSELLGSIAMRDLLRRLEESYDVVIIDSPPLLPVTDSAVLGRLVSGVLLVAAAGRTKKDQLRRSADILAAVEARTFGVVLNMVPPHGADAYDPYVYAGYESRPLTVPPQRSQNVAPTSRGALGRYVRRH